ncbi:FtsX-like permease family protein [Pedobacter sp. HMF7647]|uniref:FtsX-like permease family protein n=1 Tax=Hufsiella arboris TaxID=2695275 RepID=A0A7K1Y7K7_9SPHI|nr:ABC transporter permease [Hufsiella arboris]MXV50555.1 FtsX-like permease family protein [Hufsiella arboris]
MLKNYFRSAFRNLVKNKTFSIINIAGLAIGMAAGLLIIQYVSFELSYDNFHQYKPRIYRVVQDRYNNGKLSTSWANGTFACGQAFKAGVPEVEDFVKLVGAGQVLASYQDRKTVIENDYYASNSFFKVFSFPLLYGDPRTALQDPHTVVISQTVSEKLFPHSNPVGKLLTINKDVALKITGVFRDLPSNTHMKFDMLQAFASFLKLFPPKDAAELDNNWDVDGCLTYLLLKPGADPKNVETKFLPIVKKAFEPLAGENGIYSLMPLQDIHLTSHLMGEMKPNGDEKSIYLLAAAAIFIIVIAWINYINLATAKGISRAKEVGVRKTLGSAKKQLFAQFMIEAMLLNAIAVVAAMILIAAALPLFSSLSGYQITFGMLVTPSFLVAVLIVFILGSLFSGFYPAIVLSSFRPVQILKGRLSSSPKGIILRKAMVVFQFAASIFLLIGSLTVYRQLSYMQKQNLGLTIDQTLVINPPLAKVDSFQLAMNSFKQESLRLPAVKSVAISTTVPGQKPFWNAGGIRLVGANQEESKQYRIIGVDEDYLPAYKLKLLAGRPFSKAFRTDYQNVVFNKTGIHQLGFTDPQAAIGKRIEFWGKQYTVIGVVDDFHQESLHEAYDALIFRLLPGINGAVSVKLKTGDLQSTVAGLKRNWNSFFPGDEFNYFFLDQHFNEQYKADQHFGQIFALFTGIGIFVACLGLFGLVSFTIIQRTKEIGIRKVLGASVTGILQLLYSDFAKLLIVAFLISVPIAWYACQKWLKTYAFKADISWGQFALAFMIVLLVGFVSVSYLTIKAALNNPVNSLKTE